MGIEEVIIAARSAWQTPYVERMIGSIRRECLENVGVLGERHLQRILKDYFSHYHESGATAGTLLATNNNRSAGFPLLAKPRIS